LRGVGGGSAGLLAEKAAHVGGCGGGGGRGSESLGGSVSRSVGRHLGRLVGAGGGMLDLQSLLSAHE
jgi:hypothetical protein